MPKYFVKDFSGREHEIALDMLLRPQSYHGGGSVEQAQAQAQANAEAIGRLLALFVEMKTMDLSTAKQIAGIFDDVHVVNSPFEGV